MLKQTGFQTPRRLTEHFTDVYPTTTNGGRNGKIITQNSMTETPEPNQRHRPRNYVLTGMSCDLWMRLSPYIGHSLLIQGRPVFEIGQPVKRVYFPNSGLISQVIDSRAGGRVETSILGREGMIGLSEALSGTPASTRTVVHIAGTACWLPAEVLRDEFRRGGAFQDWMLRHLHWQTAQAIHNGLCNRLHSVEERLARWLLAAQERLETDDIAVTHDSIAQMMGTRRSSVTVGLGKFERAGLLHCARGRTIIQDKNGLQNYACECHQTLRSQQIALRLSEITLSSMEDSNRVDTEPAESYKG